MRIEQFRHVVAVVEHGSFRSAAETLHLTQPALSQSVRALERQFGAELLNRNGVGPIKWSEAGRRLEPYIRDVMRAEEALKFELASVGSAEGGTVRLGVVNATAATILPRVIEYFHEHFPRTRLLITEASSSSVRAGVESDEFDLGCLVESVEEAAQDGAILRTRLMDSEVVACVSPDHPWTRRSFIDVEDLVGAPLILHNPGYFMRDWIDAQIPQGDQNVVYSTNNTASVLRLVAHGVGVTLLPRCSASGGTEVELSRLNVLQDGQPIYVQLSAITRNSRYLPRSVSLLISELTHEAASWERSSGPS